MSWKRFGPSWERLGRVLGRLGRILARLGRVLGRLGGVLGASWSVLERLERGLKRLERGWTEIMLRAEPGMQLAWAPGKYNYQDTEDLHRKTTYTRRLLTEKLHTYTE